MLLNMLFKITNLVKYISYRTLHFKTPEAEKLTWQDLLVLGKDTDRWLCGPNIMSGVNVVV